jgi:large subunit ribosomal protein L15
LIKRLPRKRGFTNIFRTEYAIINVSRLDVFEPGTEVTPQLLVEAGLAKSLRRPIKILGEGEIHRPLTVKANKLSPAAREKIEAAGGKVEEIGSAAETR